MSSLPLRKQRPGRGYVWKVALQEIFCLSNLQILNNITESKMARGRVMSTGQAIVFGMMLSWTPSLILLAWILWKEHIGIKDAP
jgi:hypothetical protein